MLKARIVGMMFMAAQPAPENKEVPIEAKKEALKPADQLQNAMKVMQTGKVLEGIGTIMKNAVENPDFKKLLTPDKVNEVKNTALEALKNKSIPLLTELPMKAVQDSLVQLNSMVALTAPPKGVTESNATQVATNPKGNDFTAPPQGITAPPRGITDKDTTQEA